MSHDAVQKVKTGQMPHFSKSNINFSEGCIVDDSAKRFAKSHNNQSYLMSHKKLIILKFYKLF